MGAIKQGQYSILPQVAALPSPVAGLEGVIVELTSDKKCYYCDGATWVDLSATGGGGGLSPTAVKTANYTAVANDLVRADSAGGPFTVTLPASPADGAQIGILDITKNCGTNAVLVSPNGKTIEGDSGGLSIDLAGAYIQLLYTASGTNWKVVDTLASGYAEATAGGGGSTFSEFLLMGA